MKRKEITNHCIFIISRFNLTSPFSIKTGNKISRKELSRHQRTISIALYLRERYQGGMEASETSNALFERRRSKFLRSNYFFQIACNVYRIIQLVCHKLHCEILIIYLTLDYCVSSWWAILVTVISSNHSFFYIIWLPGCSTRSCRFRKVICSLILIYKMFSIHYIG